MMTRMAKIFVLILGGAVVLFSHGLSLHISVGIKTFDVWKDFDYQFYKDITDPPNWLEGIKIKKFYYIGLTFPDMFWKQSALKTIIDTLYNYRDELKIPLKIREWTKQNVQVPIKFWYGDDSHNLAKLWEMAKYAKNRGWSSYEKALIYGSLMHVIHDRYGHMVMQPALFGYGLVYDSDSALSQPLLKYAETYHELFSPTHIVDWKFVRILYYSIKIDIYGNPSLLRDACSFYEERNLKLQYYKTWQDRDFLPVKRYVDAAKAVGWQMENLTQERLESYLAGYAIITFLAYGYREDGSDIGGLFGHPLWSFDQYFDFVAEIGSEFYYHWFFSKLPSPVQKWVKRKAFSVIRVRGMFPEVHGHLNWYEYFETCEGLKDLFLSMPPDLQEALKAEYKRMDRNLDFWEWSDFYGNHPRWPQFRASYIDEPDIAVELNKFYKKSLAEGATYLDEEMTHQGKRLEVWTLARKAGLLAGLYSIPAITYPRPPGIVYQYFAKKNNEWELAYTYLEAEDYLPIRLYYDMFVRGRMRLQIRGNTKNGGDVLLAEKDFDLPEIWERKTGYLEANVYQQDVVEIYWRVETWDRRYSILQSDYREAYWHSPLVYENKLYQTLFKNGDPLRYSIYERPLYWGGSKKYWPYTIRIYCLLSPAGLDVKRFSTNQVKLTWQDRSGKETGFQIARRLEGEDWIEDYKTVAANSTFEYDTVSVAHRYTYKVQGFDDQDHTHAGDGFLLG